MNELISQFFGDPNIILSCPISGECMHYSQVPGYERPVNRQGKLFIHLQVSRLPLSLSWLLFVSFSLLA